MTTQFSGYAHTFLGFFKCCLHDSIISSVPHFVFTHVTLSTKSELGEERFLYIFTNNFSLRVRQCI